MICLVYGFRVSSVWPLRLFFFWACEEAEHHGKEKLLTPWWRKTVRAKKERERKKWREGGERKRRDTKRKREYEADRKREAGGSIYPSRSGLQWHTWLQLILFAVFPSLPKGLLNYEPINGLVHWSDQILHYSITSPSLHFWTLLLWGPSFQYISFWGHF